MSATRRSTLRLLVVAAGLALGLAACRSAAPPAPATGQEMERAVARLRAPLPPAMAALYRLRLPSTGGLRLTLLVDGARGTIGIAEPFGGLVSLTSWQGPEATATMDYRAGCRLEGAAGLAAALGFELLPPDRIALLLGGRLPATAEDRVELLDRQRVRVSGERFGLVATLENEPWRVVAVTADAGAGGAGWKLLLSDHSASLPGTILARHEDGRWAELTLAQLQWELSGELPQLPEAPVCGVVRQ